MPDFARRSLLALPLVAPLFAPGGTPFAAGLAAMPIRSEQEPTLSDDLSHYVDLGVHRAGTTGERKTAVWLNARLQKLGYTSQIDRFPISTIIDPSGRLQFAGQDISVFPQWTPPANAFGKISAPLRALSDDPGPATIRFVASPVSFTASWNRALDQLAIEAKAKGALALIVAIDIPSGELFVSNQHSSALLPLPVALVAKRDLPRLQSASGVQANLRLKGKPAKTHSLNVIGEKQVQSQGQSQGGSQGKRIVISTPLTGWFACGAERGPGIALWLRLARYLATQNVPVTMLGTGSHEIGYLGIDHALTNYGPKPDDVALWLHLGASLGATRLDREFAFTSPQYLVGLPGSAQAAKQAFAEHLPIYVSGDAKTQGEAGPIIAAGHRNFIGMSGMFPTFHTPVDLGQAVDFAKLEQIAQAAEGLVQQVVGAG